MSLHSEEKFFFNGPKGFRAALGRAAELESASVSAFVRRATLNRMAALGVRVEGVEPDEETIQSAVQPFALPASRAHEQENFLSRTLDAVACEAIVIAVAARDPELVASIIPRVVSYLLTLYPEPQVDPERIGHVLGARLDILGFDRVDIARRIAASDPTLPDAAEAV